MKTKDLKDTNQFDKFKEVSIIGRQYNPIDNSYSCNLSKQAVINGQLTCDYIAGTSNTLATKVTIATEPFTVEISCMDKKHSHEFVIVVDGGGASHFILYNERGLI